MTSCDFFQAGVTLAKPTLMGSSGSGRATATCSSRSAQEPPLLAFRLGRAAPGDLVGNFRLGIARPCLALGASFTVTVARATALLDNGQGTLSESATTDTSRSSPARSPRAAPSTPTASRAARSPPGPSSARRGPARQSNPPGSE